MDLIKSKTEQEFREELVKSYNFLTDSEDGKRIRDILFKSYPQMTIAFIIEWIPEQEEDFYKILINDNIVTEIELKHDSIQEPKIKSLSLLQYLHRRSKRVQIKLAVAIELAKTLPPIMRRNVDD